MDRGRFVLLSRSLGDVPSRRDVLRGLAAAGIALEAARLPILTGAKKKRRRKRKKQKSVKPNENGCFEVGDPCQSADDCCSGICAGRKGKRRCRAHDGGTCNQSAAGYCEAGNPELTICNGGGCLCFRTTGGSNVCTNNVFCANCRKDADCLALGYAPGSACAPVGGDLACSELCEETGMACIAPCTDLPPAM